MDIRMLSAMQEQKKNRYHDSAVSEVIGSVMLISVVVIAIAIIGVVLTSQPLPQKIPALDAIISSNGNDTIRIYHNGGDALLRQEMIILVDGVDTTSGFTIRGSGWTTWSPGESLDYITGSLPGKVQILFTGGSSQTVLVSTDFAGGMPTFVPTAIPTPGEAAIVTGINPNIGITGSSIPTMISGAGFVDGAAARLVQGSSVIPAMNVLVVSQNQINCVFNLNGALTGQWNVTVTNPGSTSGTLSNGFTVIPAGPAPTLLRITPNSGNSSSAVNIRNLTGTNFISGASVILSRTGNPDLYASDVIVLDSTNLTCTFTLPAGTSPGSWDVTLRNTDGQSGVLPNGFTVNNPGPVITGISPDSGLTGNSITITSLAGSGFQNGATVILNSSSAPVIVASGVMVVNQNQIICTVDLAGAPLGTRNVVVTNPDGRVAVLPNGFLVKGAVVVVSGISPSSGIVGSTVVPVSIGGNGFMSGATVRLNKTGDPDIIASGVNVGSSNLITCSISLPAGATPGLWNVVVNNADGQVGILPAGFRVKTPTPTVTAITPNTQVRGWNVNITNLAGTNFRSGAFVSLVNSSAGPDIIATNVVIVSATRITCTFDLSSAMAAPRNVTVTNQYSDTGIFTNGFTVTGNAPTLTARNVSSGNRGWPVGVSLTGTGFQPGATVRLTRAGYSDIIATGVTVVSPTQITCSFNLLGATAGTWNILVTNPDGKTSGTLTFVVNSPTPTISTSTPATGVRGTSVSITSLTGTGFQPGALVDYYSGVTRINLTDVNVMSGTQLSGTLNIPSGATAGSYGVRVINTDGTTVSRTGRFTVTNPPPTVSAISPIQGRDGMVVSPVIVTGTNFLTGAQVRLYRGTTLIYTAPAGTVNSPTQITTSFSLPETVVVGVTDVRVTNTDALYGMLPNGYTIQE
jgi:hypothetical protein